MYVFNGMCVFPGGVEPLFFERGHARPMLDGESLADLPKERDICRRLSSSVMAGIYLHIPFCASRCAYCDFYSTTRSDLRDPFVDALCQELRSRRDYLQGEPVRTVYLGGGTPSQLTVAQLERIFTTIEQTYGLGACEEITLEANPDDLTSAYVEAVHHHLPVNRLSMGIQTFHQPTLTLLHRRHTARQAVQAVQTCCRAGFRHISVDLIYGLPGQTEERWADDLQQAVALGVEHLSAYHLTYEPGTALHRMLSRGELNEVDEELSLRLFGLLIDTLTAAGYTHYEISNFCLPGRHSRHNSAYWQGIAYLGCGPSAHSYDLVSREWNTADLTAYLHGISTGRRPYEREVLDLRTRYNERVMTALRTAQGLDLAALRLAFGPELHDYCLRLAAPYIRSARLRLADDHRLCLTRQGLFVSDSIISDLMAVDD